METSADVPVVTKTPSGDDGINLDRYAAKSYLDYALSVVKGRALPDVGDGLKPVHRRFLFAMNELGLTSTSKPVKSARVVGDVLGKYHPHGDSSVYDAMVRTAQDFSLRYPFIDGQGNFGSRDGDGAAAMRYTEVRLSRFAELLLSELHDGTVDFTDNYDGQFLEPSVLPARLPVVLANHSHGIAVGMACEIPSHNLRELAAAAVLLIKRPEATLDEVMAVLPGPDMAGGGQLVCSHQVIRAAYETGRGSLAMRARWVKEDLARGQWRIVFYEMPHGVSSADVLMQIGEATNPKIKAGKKDLTQEQKNLKALMLSMIDRVYDDSNKDTPVRLIVDPKSSKQSPEELVECLMQHTSLAATAPVNLTMLGRDRRPQRKPLVSILKEWIDFRFDVVRRRLRHRLEQVDHRIEILEGRLLVFLHVMEVIRIIRESDEPRPALVERFKLTEVQVTDILEIRLRQLARLEGFVLEKEAQQLREERAHLQHLLSDGGALTDKIVGEIEADALAYGDDRRTLIEEVATVGRPAAILDEPCTLILSANGWIRNRQGHGIARDSITYKPGDSEMAVVETRTGGDLVVLDSNGRAYSIRASDVPNGRGDGVPVTSLIDLQPGPNGTGKIMYAWSAGGEDRFLFSSSAGYGYITEFKNLVGRNRAGKQFQTIERDERVLPPVAIPSLEGWLAVASVGPVESRMLMFRVDEVKSIPKGLGVVLMQVEAGEEMATVILAQPDQVRVTVAGKTAVIRGEHLNGYRLRRARKGRLLDKKRLTWKDLQLA